MTHYRTQDTGIACWDESATLTGETFDGLSIEGSDSIQTVGCRVTRRPAIWMKDQDRPDTDRQGGPVNVERDQPLRNWAISSALRGEGRAGRGRSESVKNKPFWCRTGSPVLRDGEIENVPDLGIPSSKPRH